MTTTNTQTSSGQPDRRVTIRLRHHCDADLIQVLEQVSNVSEFIRQALRRDHNAQRHRRRVDLDDFVTRGEIQPPSEAVNYRRVS